MDNPSDNPPYGDLDSPHQPGSTLQKPPATNEAAAPAPGLIPSDDNNVNTAHGSGSPIKQNDPLSPPPSATKPASSSSTGGIDGDDDNNNNPERGQYVVTADGVKNWREESISLFVHDDDDDLFGRHHSNNNDDYISDDEDDLVEISELGGLPSASRDKMQGHVWGEKPEKSGAGQGRVKDEVEAVEEDEEKPIFIKQERKESGGLSFFDRGYTIEDDGFEFVVPKSKGKGKSAAEPILIDNEKQDSRVVVDDEDDKLPISIENNENNNRQNGSAAAAGVAIIMDDDDGEKEKEKENKSRGTGLKDARARYLELSSQKHALMAKKKKNGGALSPAEEREWRKLEVNMKKDEAIINNDSLENESESESEDDEEDNNGEDGDFSDGEEAVADDDEKDEDFVDRPATNHTNPTQKRKRPAAQKGDNRASPKKKRKTAKGPRPKSAQEWWAREYENRGKSALPNLFVDEEDNNKKGKGKVKGQAAGSGAGGGGHQRDQLDHMLENPDPVQARANLGTIDRRKAIEASNKKSWGAHVSANLKSMLMTPDAKREKKLLVRATTGFGVAKCKPKDGNWAIPGMKTHLFPHQVVAVHWMLGKEYSPQAPYGGILADQMGLGKTVEILATMSQNLGEAPTLIVAPAAAIPQWITEIKKHCAFTENSRPWHYKASNPNQHPDDLSQKRIIIASYYEVAKAMPSEDALLHLDGTDLGDEEEARRRRCEEVDKLTGDLLKIDFHRVVLDEAHAIKNYKSRTSKACVQIRAKHRWALTGTPLHNSVDELYPYLQFLKANWAGDFRAFKKKFGATKGDEDTKKARLAAIVPTLMIRRRVHDKFMGEHILDIPTTHPVKIVRMSLSVEENLIYRRLEDRFRDSLNADIRNGVAHSMMANYLAKLTRLRQATAHPFLLETCMRKDLNLEDIVWIRAQLVKMGGKSTLHQQISMFLSEEEARRRRDGDGDSGEGEGEGESGGGPAELGTSGFGGYFGMDQQLQRIQSEKLLRDTTCRRCFDLPENARITIPCGHAFCFECIEPDVQNAVSIGKEHKCPVCQCNIESTEDLADAGGKGRYDSDPEGGGGDGGGGGGGKRSRQKQPEMGDDLRGMQPRAPIKSKFLELADRDPAQPVTPSAKTTAIKHVVLEWLRDFPNDKIIIFTHWVPLGRILGRVLAAEKVPFLYYFGSMDAGQRKDAIDDFSRDGGDGDEPYARVLIASTKCGGQSLNLTAANRIILVDLWWNSAVERQAFGRVHRIGQRKETHYVKIVTRNTIDQRLLRMQAVKDKIISETLHDDGRAVKKLTVDDIRFLFGDTDKLEHEDRHDNSCNDDENAGEGPSSGAARPAGGGGGGARKTTAAGKKSGGGGARVATTNARPAQKRPSGPRKPSHRGIKTCAAQPRQQQQPTTSKARPAAPTSAESSAPTQSTTNTARPIIAPAPPPAIAPRPAHPLVPGSSRDAPVVLDSSTARLIIDDDTDEDVEDNDAAEEEEDEDEDDDDGDDDDDNGDDDDDIKMIDADRPLPTTEPAEDAYMEDLAGGFPGVVAGGAGGGRSPSNMFVDDEGDVSGLE